ncbi:alpha/beta hydrolase-fold protein [Niabella hirudinis]|uniref:alpha/beta hydrolase-fold protein n=1 Tax=Niabella hirudinis TaxID=1285929 RepID=UPI003EBD4B7C
MEIETFYPREERLKTFIEYYYFVKSDSPDFNAEYYAFPNTCQALNIHKDIEYSIDAQSSALYDFTKATLAFFPGYANFYFDPVILVGIETKNRHFEFLPKHVNTTPGRQNYLKAGGADTLALSIEKEIKPLIEKKYRTNGFTIGIGHSLGGTFVTYAMLQYPKIFNAGICISSNYVFDNEAIFSLYKEAAQKDRLADRFLYIGYGNGDETEEKFKKSTIKMGELLKQQRIPNFNYKVDGLNNNSHSTTPMEGVFKGLVFINDFMNLPYEKYQPFLKADSSGDLVAYVKAYFEQQKLKTKAPLPGIGELNTIAYNIFSAGKKEEAIRLLEWAVLLYPDNANLYDSMGEMLESTGDLKKAADCYNRGLSIIKAQKDRLSEQTYTSKINWFHKRLAEIHKR